uniref:Radical SAM core domain-containing protein n=1 Tax=Spongospora subterranea TaxID=70186 RepID=A0A0H5QHJ7_9EUKA|eukprot:CRZ01500.1 hypothetical protein [Spongospora subterranea]
MRCNLRCHYCMPESGVSLTPNPLLLTALEIHQIAKLFVSQGVNKIRLTGGEPLVRRDIVEIVSNLNKLRPDGLSTIAMTTNGLLLSRYLPELIDAGLTHVNISLDTLSPHRFQLISKRMGHERVLRSIDDAIQSGLKSVKINCVVMNGINADEIIDFVELTRSKLVEVRFIEMMPFASNTFDNRKLLPFKAMLGMIQQAYPDIYKAVPESNETSKVYNIPGFVGRIGFITSMRYVVSLASGRNLCV